MLTKTLSHVLCRTTNSPCANAIFIIVTLLCFTVFMNVGYASDRNNYRDSISDEGRRAHASITEYLGPETCIGCHELEALDVHSSVHYQQTGMTPNVTNIAGTAGKSEDAFNTYCGSVRTSPTSVRTPWRQTPARAAPTRGSSSTTR